MCVCGYVTFWRHVKTCMFVPCSGRLGARSSVCFRVWRRLVWNLLSHAHVCVFSLFLTPMFVLLQDSVPMASPAFLLSLFVSIQVLPPISPEPGHAPYTLVSTQTHTYTMWHTLYTSVFTSHCFSFSQFSSSEVALKKAKTDLTADIILLQIYLSCIYQPISNNKSQYRNAKVGLR